MIIRKGIWVRGSEIIRNPNFDWAVADLRFKALGGPTMRRLHLAFSLGYLQARKSDVW
jgi:hypothetical protein